MAWCTNINTNSNDNNPISHNKSGFVLGSKIDKFRAISCPSCGHHVPIQGQASGIDDLPGMPAGLKFDPTDLEILGHLEAKVKSDFSKLHPLLGEFIPTIEGENGICYTHPEKLPGVSKDGIMRHFFHRPSKAYTTGTRKRRKVNTSDEDGGETRWHKTGKTRPVVVDGSVKGFKKILVLYTNYGRQRKPEKTNWVMHQYHLGIDEEEKDGEFVLSKVFYQTQPRQCGAPSIATKEPIDDDNDPPHHHHPMMKGHINYYHPSFIAYDHDHVVGEPNRENPSQLIPNLMVHGDGSSMFQLLGARK